MKYSSYGHKIIQHFAFLSQNHVLGKPILLLLNYSFPKSSNGLIRIANIYGCSNVTKFNIKNQLNLKMSSKNAYATTSEWVKPKFSKIFNLEKKH